MATTGGDQPAGLLGRVAGAVTGKVADVVDPDVLLDRVDMERLVARIDPNDLLDRIDVNAFLDRVDVNAFLDRVDVNRLLERVDVDALLARTDIEAVVRRSGVPDLVTSSTTRLAGSLVDVGRRQVVGLDTIIDRGVDGLLRRQPDPAREAPPGLRSLASNTRGASGRLGVTGRYAGVLSRTLSAAADVVIASVLFTLLVAGLSVLTETFLDRRLSGDSAGVWGLGAWAVWGFLYSWVSLTITGRTPGKAIVGVRVVSAGGGTIGAGQALVRTLVLPVSTVAGGLGLLLAVVHPQHRALHDLLSGTAVVYDWGDRPAELPGPLSAYVARHTDEASAD